MAVPRWIKFGQHNHRFFTVVKIFSASLTFACQIRAFCKGTSFWTVIWRFICLSLDFVFIKCTPDMLESWRLLWLNLPIGGIQSWLAFALRVPNGCIFWSYVLMAWMTFGGSDFWIVSICFGSRASRPKELLINIAMVGSVKFPSLHHSLDCDCALLAYW